MIYLHVFSVYNPHLQYCTLFILIY